MKKILLRPFLVISCLVLLTFAAFSSVYAAGETDTSFQGYLARAGQGNVYRSVLQPDGKLIISGSFNMVNGAYRRTIVRLNADGSLDTSFNSPTIAGFEQVNIHGIGLQSNGKIVIAGPFYQINGVTRRGIARLNADGSPDTAFNSNPALNNIQQGFDVKIAPDDKIVFSGLEASNIAIRTVMRLHPDGSLDAKTTRDAFMLDIQSDGKIVYYGSSEGVRRLNQDLTLDNTFTQVIPNATVYRIKALPDGKTLISGIFTRINGTLSPSLVRINSDGSVDASFAANMSGGGGSAAVIYLPDGKLIVASGGTLTLRNADGTLNPSFSATTSMQGINDLHLQPDGKIIATGSAATISTFRALAVRVNSDGSNDASFQAAIGMFSYGNRVKVLPDNKFYATGSPITGHYNYASGAPRYALARFNADGTIDTTFNQTVFTSLSGNQLLFDVFPDGKVIAQAGNTVVKFNVDGSVDLFFTSFNSVQDIKALPDGKVLVARQVNKLELYNADGTLNTSFNVPVTGLIYDIAVQPDGKIIIGGSFEQVNGVNRSKIARLHPDGTLDTSFNSPAGGIDGVVTFTVLSPGGKIVIAGSFTGISFNTRQGLARLNSDGSLDTGFVPPQSYSLDDVKVQPDGKVIHSGANIPSIRRLNANGSIDTTFNTTLSVENSDYPRVRGLDLQTDGKIVIAGDFLRVNGVLAPGIARLLNAPPRRLFDYDGDGRADISVFRPSENKWYVLRSSDGQVTQQIFAIAGDVPVPSDYDGDGKTDFAIYRPSAGDWWYQSSVNGSQGFADWGQANVVARPSDFDGDGKSDFIYFLPANSTWYRYGTTAGASYVAFGLAGDKPVTGDFDGDGKTDVAIYRPSTGDWWWQSSIDNVQRATHWGISTDIPAPADYDGDGKTDFAVYRPSTGTWYVYNSLTNSSTALNFGLAEDKPVPADYDGDGKADIAVFRPSTGVWYLMKSTEGFSAVQFGVSSDIPTPNAFIP